MKRQVVYLILFLIVVASCRKEKEEPRAVPLELHKLNIEFDGEIPIDSKIKMKLHETKGDAVKVYKGKIERRGGFSISAPKHSYEIDLKKDVPLAKLPEDDDWIVNANYIDKTFLRHVVSFELFRDMDADNEAALTKYAEISLNGVYNGLYVLMEKLDKSSLEVDGKDDKAIIFKEPKLFKESYGGVNPQDVSNFHQQTFPKIAEEDRLADIELIRSFILNSTDDNFRIEMPKVFDIDNIIDWHLLILITNNGDGVLKNFYLYKKDSETPVRIAPWDYDHSFGRDGDNELNLDERPPNIERSILFKRLLKFDWYKIALKATWTELNEQDLLSEAGLKQRINKASSAVRKEALKNFDIWPVDAPKYYDANGFDEEIDIMLEFIGLRHHRLTEYFEQL